ncbi:MAG: hypothetical protein ACJ74W_02005 [Pyrinomonadaceae bacterium]
MKIRVKLSKAGDRRRNERGAALMMMLLVSMLLLAAGGALILSSAMSTSLAYDAGGEVQAYYAAEAGIEDTLSALRGHYAPNPVVVTQVGSEIPPENQLSFRAAVTAQTSNKPGEPAGNYRLSRWLGYDYQSDPALGYNDRKIVDGPYSIVRGTTYNVSVVDPDNSQNVAFSTTGTINGSSTFTQNGVVAGDYATITFNSAASTALVAYPAANTTLGSLNVAYHITLPATNISVAKTPFQLRINQTAPWPGQFIISGTIEGLVTPVGGTLALNFTTMTAVIAGARYDITAAVNPMPVVTTVATGSPTSIPVRVTAPDPRQLIVRSTGYGPKGARKQLEMVVDNFLFMINPPSPICIRGADDQASPMTFALGNSNAHVYSGVDDSGQLQTTQPAVSISLHDWTVANNGLGGGTVTNPKLAILDLTYPPSANPNPNPIPSPWPAALTPTPQPSPGSPALPPAVTTPDFLRTADAAREFLYGPTGDGTGGLMAIAQSRGRYFNTPFDGMAGDYNQGGFTFVDNDCVLDGGGGLLVVTGNLTLRGQDDFRGLILVMGNGQVTRSGGGNGVVKGAWLVARFARNGPGDFLAPTFNVSGAGTSDFLFDWDAIVGANRGVGISISGIAER